MAPAANKRLTGTERLAKSVVRLSRLLTRERDRLPEAYLRDRELREAYKEYYLPANLPKIWVPLGELALHPARLLERGKLRVLDIGCGPGTSLLGVLAFFGKLDRRPVLELTAVDAVNDNLAEARAFFRERGLSYEGTSLLRTVTCAAEEVTARIRERYDLIILSNVLNELYAGQKGRTEKRVRLAGNILKELLHETGSCIVIEPSLRETSRDMLEVRDGLLAEGIHLYSPCLTQARCPALEHPRDWCHEDRSWEPPEIVAKIDKQTGLRKDSLKFSYMVLRKDSCSLSDLAGPGAFRIVSEQLRSRGKCEYYVCGPGGRRLVVRLDKDTTSDNKSFSDLQRGDAVLFEGLLDEEDRYRIAKATLVRRHPFIRGDRLEP